MSAPSSRYRRAPAGGGIRIVAAVRAMSAVMRRAAARGAVPCRISPAVSFLRLVEYRFSSHRTVRSFWHPACRFGVSCCIRLRCMASCRLGEAAVFVSLPSRFVALSHRIDTSHRSVSSHRFVSSRHVRRYALLDTGGGKGIECHSIIHMHDDLKQFRMVFQDDKSACDRNENSDTMADDVIHDDVDNSDNVDSVDADAKNQQSSDDVKPHEPLPEQLE